MTNLALKPTSTAVDYVSYEDGVVRDFQISAKTSIARRAPAAPLKQVVNGGGIEGKVLNYGKGRDEMDSDFMGALERVDAVFNYDYTHCPFPEVLVAQAYDTVWCGYVTNTLPPMAREHVYRQMAHVIKQDGVVYIAARSDKDRGIKGEAEYDGFRNQHSGTWQKGYALGELAEEARRHFTYVEESAGKGAFRIVRCSHTPLKAI